MEQPLYSFVKKNKSTLEYYELALKVKEITDFYHIPLIIDDRIDVAMAVGCGVHLGNEDMPISVARKIMGKDCIIGATAKTVEVAKKQRLMVLTIWVVVPFIRQRRM